MMMSFLAQLIKSVDAAHLYRIIMDGGERFAFLVLDAGSREVFSSTSAGEPAGDIRLSLEDGSLLPSRGGESSESEAHMSREEFALISGSIRREWAKEGSPPLMVTKTYG
ncbi:hypothetical protein RM780_21200 [Streptomyces sp. DSM 44917]|uniref:Cyclic nucleotide-binding domain-containing protein n=1 Tax=Streptomyces boetiae TaxID=3075541 RepID=A0ABU2LE50_9ACTN|nr:hypothetical protein [Streptomyces sp. DSM 44917]MDT0309458.1 hypothetical protein [Streptomyces sp. DSM 44917]